MYYLMLKNKKTGRKTLHSVNGQTEIFDSRKEAMDEGVSLYGENNPSVSCYALALLTADPSLPRDRKSILARMRKR